MKNIIKSFIIAVLVGSVNAMAQEASNEAPTPREASSPDRFVRRIIPQASLANAGLEGGDTSRYSKPNGYTAGVLFDLVGAHEMVVESGALYRQFGTDVRSGLGNNSFTANYISVPVSLKYYFRGQEATSAYLKAGLMGSTRISNNTVYATETTRIGAREWETAALAGLGMKFNLTPTTDMILEADYNRALNSLFDDYEVYRSDLSAALGFAVNL